MVRSRAATAASSGSSASAMAVRSTAPPLQRDVVEPQGAPDLAQRRGGVGGGVDGDRGGVELLGEAGHDEPEAPVAVEGVAGVLEPALGVAEPLDGAVDVAAGGGGAGGAEGIDAVEDGAPGPQAAEQPGRRAEQQHPADGEHHPEGAAPAATRGALPPGHGDGDGHDGAAEDPQQGRPVAALDHREQAISPADRPVRRDDGRSWPAVRAATTTPAAAKARPRPEPAITAATAPAGSSTRALA